MLSPAARHRIETLARLAAEKSDSEGIAAPRPETGAEATEYELIMQQLGNDMRQLSDIQSQELKIEAKRAMVASYADHVAGALHAADATGKAVQDEILVTMMIWNFDIGAWDYALLLAEHVLRYRLTLPDRFKRTAATMIAEEVAEGAFAAFRIDTDFPLDVLQRALGLTEGYDMPDQVRAKLNKAIALQLLRVATAAEEKGDGPAGGPTAARRQALAHFQRALSLDSKVGVKKDIEKLTALLNKAPPEDAADHAS
ncbi:terminase [Sphingobium sp. SCG-1]|uniref:phage terminase small subunit n=1 Tax=Sphingobium sp. SCG-1 TaxID=2072936 RepID=UPI000CD698B6|nr:phage terminase small subunit [Sphingobium sp. SCG-1]AUW59449.1 terminase [Sphingobium sp. SCG-1]